MALTLASNALSRTLGWPSSANPSVAVATSLPSPQDWETTAPKEDDRIVGGRIIELDSDDPEADDVTGDRYQPQHPVAEPNAPPSVGTLDPPALQLTPVPRHDRSTGRAEEGESDELAPESVTCSEGPRDESIDGTTSPLSAKNLATVTSQEALKKPMWGDRMGGWVMRARGDRPASSAMTRNQVPPRPQLKRRASVESAVTIPHSDSASTQFISYDPERPDAEFHARVDQVASRNDAHTQALQQSLQLSRSRPDTRPYPIQQTFGEETALNKNTRFQVSTGGPRTSRAEADRRQFEELRRQRQTVRYLTDTYLGQQHLFDTMMSAFRPQLDDYITACVDDRVRSILGRSMQHPLLPRSAFAPFPEPFAFPTFPRQLGGGSDLFSQIQSLHQPGSVMQITISSGNPGANVSYGAAQYPGVYGNVDNRSFGGYTAESISARPSIFTQYPAPAAHGLRQQRIRGSPVRDIRSQGTDATRHSANQQALQDEFLQWRERRLAEQSQSNAYSRGPTSGNMTGAPTFNPLADQSMTGQHLLTGY